MEIARTRSQGTRREELQARLLGELEALAPQTERLALDFHRMPELGSEEVNTVQRFAGELEEEDFHVTTGVGGLTTAFRAERSSARRPCVGFLAEYDAIPGLGHACGHNLICAASFAAAVALSRLLDEVPGTVALIGAPAEETFGGKIVLVHRGAYDGLDVALLAHPGSENRALVQSMASWSFEVVFEGKTAHAVAAPEEGVNALDAMIQLFVAKDALVKSLDPSVRIPGVILEGGVRPNVIPARARARFSLRARDADYLVDVVARRFRELVTSVSLATNAQARIEPVDNLYDEFQANPALAELWTQHARSLGVQLAEGSGRTIGSLDMGALSHRVPALHPLFSIVEAPVPTHTSSFTEASRAGFAVLSTQRAARVLALAGLDILVEPGLLARVRETHRERPASLLARRDAPLVAE